MVIVGFKCGCFSDAAYHHLHRLIFNLNSDLVLDAINYYFDYCSFACLITATTLSKTSYRYFDTNYYFLWICYLRQLYSNHCHIHNSSYASGFVQHHFSCYCIACPINFYFRSCDGPLLYISMNATKPIHRYSHCEYYVLMIHFHRGCSWGRYSHSGYPSINFHFQNHFKSCCAFDFWELLLTISSYSGSDNFSCRSFCRRQDGMSHEDLPDFHQHLNHACCRGFYIFAVGNLYPVNDGTDGSHRLRGDDPRNDVTNFGHKSHCLASWQYPD